MSETRSCSPTDECEGANLLTNGDFAQGTAGGLPTGWEAVCPNPALAPRFVWVRDEHGRTMLRATGNGRRECFGYVRQRLRLEGGKTYCLRVRLRAQGLEDLNRHLVHGFFGHFNDGIWSYRREGQWAVGESRFPADAKPGDGEVRLYFRFSAEGSVTWSEVSLRECAPAAPRVAKVACSWGTGDLAHWERWLASAGEQQVDIALLPEFFNGKDATQAEPLDGPSGTFLSQQARKWGLYLSGTFAEKRGDLVFNTAPLYGRDGQLVGSYSKNMLYDPEEDQGTTPGLGYPVFRTDVGKVGIIVCYDSWFPEPCRLLGYKSAELVLFPNAGYYVDIMPARAADSALWIVTSSLNCPANVWDPSGARAGEEFPEPTRFAPPSIVAYTKDDKLRMITATLDLSRRFSPHWWGGPLRSAPGGRRVRSTAMAGLEDEIARQAKRWWEED